MSRSTSSGTCARGSLGTAVKTATDRISSRQLRTPWTDAWEAEGAPEPLAMPLQSLISEPALKRIDKLSEGGHKGAQELATYWVGQGVGLMNESLTARQVVQAFREDFVTAYERLAKAVGA